MGRRRAAIREIWPEDGEHASPSYYVRGYEQLEERITRTHTRWVAAEGYRFRVREEPAQHHGVLKFRWEMVPQSGGAARSAGTDFLILGDDGRARAVYQFPDA
ncbi:MAG TPA: nuclear transport factor 2 family protein [bacterium]|nr:nuclear transport factor 2 family protein [bacterium]